MEKEGVSKRQISAQLTASTVKKNDPTLPTWNALKTRRFQFKESALQVVRTDSTRSNFKTRKEDPSLVNTFQSEISSSWLVPANEDSCFEQYESGRKSQCD